MPDLPIVIPNTAAAPKDYTLSGTQELALKTVRALIDGSGAGSAFLPTLQLLDPNGHVMWEGATSSTVAAGGSADVSWFPGLGGSLGGAAGSVVSAWATHSSSFTFGPGNTTVILFANTLLTNDPSTFSFDTGLHRIASSHGGLVRSDVAVTFATTLGGVFTGQFQANMSCLDSLSNSVNGLTNPEISYTELYATNGADTFSLQGTALTNCDDSTFTPPYNYALFMQTGTEITCTAASMAITILNPTGLT